MPAGSKPGERRGGRLPGVPNKSNREIRAAAAKYGPQAIKALADLLESENETVRMNAADKLLDRGFGRPAQEQRHSGAIGSYDLTRLTDEQLHTVYDILRIASVGIGDVD
jgi:hypothetical protein